MITERSQHAILWFGRNSGPWRAAVRLGHGRCVLLSSIRVLVPMRTRYRRRAPQIKFVMSATGQLRLRYDPVTGTGVLEADDAN